MRGETKRDAEVAQRGGDEHRAKGVRCLRADMFYMVAVGCNGAHYSGVRDGGAMVTKDGPIEHGSKAEHKHCLWVLHVM